MSEWQFTRRKRKWGRTLRTGKNSIERLELISQSCCRLQYTLLVRRMWHFITRSMDEIYSRSSQGADAIFLMYLLTYRFQRNSFKLLIVVTVKQIQTRGDYNLSKSTMRQILLSPKCRITFSNTKTCAWPWR